MAEHRLTLADGRAMTAYSAVSPQGVWVFVNGDTFFIETAATSLPPEGGSHSQPPGGSHSPPPGGSHSQPPGGSHIQPQGGSQGRQASRDEAALAAPMPASVVSIAVQAGAAVKAGDVLILLEAMKMELPIRAPRDGRVASIRCRQGELVQPGVPLIDLV